MWKLLPFARAVYIASRQLREPRRKTQHRLKREIMLDGYDSSPSEPEDWIKFLWGKFKFPWLDEFSEHENCNGESRPKALGTMAMAHRIGIYAQLDEELELVLQA
jgi:hypothetical protein